MARISASHGVFAGTWWHHGYCHRAGGTGCCHRCHKHFLSERKRPLIEPHSGPLRCSGSVLRLLSEAGPIELVDRCRRIDESARRVGTVASYTEDVSSVSGGVMAALLISYARFH
jgi:hypothetical protein